MLNHFGRDMLATSARCKVDSRRLLEGGRSKGRIATSMLSTNFEKRMTQMVLDGQHARSARMLDSRTWGRRVLGGRGWGSQGGRD